MMTMFSMKPKFDLAEFLAVPAPKGRSKKRTMAAGGAQRGSAVVRDAGADKTKDADPPS
ncbi:hypothetical protein P6F26_12530 [Roseibacterium sp. SDUM158017]|uniref:hypothetical protein n=1 Tax=Roseicyclus salinarum TaxID=3036773 RepID=UPI0024155F5B|nr:hypothetical protein [Roseibacterium sp. SDUM158017]MDG4649273.1 hypothetical protein [Roseibacterium sp. SDUM158017]